MELQKKEIILNGTTSKERGPKGMFDFLHLNRDYLSKIMYELLIL